MAKVKGTDIVGLKKLFAKQGKDIENTFLSKLSESDQKTYEGIIATTWTDLDVQAKLYEAAADTLFPGKNDAVIQLCSQLAEIAYSGIYSVFLLIPKASHVAKRAASVWTSYYDQGVASVEKIEKSSLDFVVRHFPELPKTMRDGTTANISALLSKTGVKNLNVNLEEYDPEKWVWHTNWN